jgi:hypothetical protein
MDEQIPMPFNVTAVFRVQMDLVCIESQSAEAKEESGSGDEGV